MMFVQTLTTQQNTGGGLDSLHRSQKISATKDHHQHFTSTANETVVKMAVEHNVILKIHLRVHIWPGTTCTALTEVLNSYQV